ncbi:vomeronasal type-2 receptor 1-like [Pelodytes ibericus]
MDLNGCPEDIPDCRNTYRHYNGTSTLLIFCLSPQQEGYIQKGDIMIGGLFPVHTSWKDPGYSFRERNKPVICESYSTVSYSWLQVMLYAIDEINKNDLLLRNVSLGFQIYDTCVHVSQTLWRTLWTLSGVDRPVPNYQCQPRVPLALIGDATSTTTIALASLLGVYKYPQVSYAASASSLSDHFLFPSFFRTIPGDQKQANALAKLVSHMGWNWVGLLSLDDDFGILGSQILKEQLQTLGVCLAYHEVFGKDTSMEKMQLITNVVIQSSTKVVIIFSRDPFINRLVDLLIEKDHKGKVWVATNAWSNSPIVSTTEYSNTMMGTIGISFQDKQMPGFKEYLLAIRPSTSLPDDIFIAKFWEIVHSCRWLGEENSSILCTGEEKLERFKGTEYEFNEFDFRMHYMIYNSVYAIAYALHALIFYPSGNVVTSNEVLTGPRTIKPWQVLQHLKDVHFENKMGEEIYFDLNGDPPTYYDVVNWHQSINGSIEFVKVGHYSKQVSQGTELSINSSAIQWITGEKERGVTAESFQEVPIALPPTCCTREYISLGDEIYLFLCLWVRQLNPPLTILLICYSCSLGTLLAGYNCYQCFTQYLSWSRTVGQPFQLANSVLWSVVTEHPAQIIPQQNINRDILRNPHLPQTFSCTPIKVHTCQGHSRAHTSNSFDGHSSPRDYVLNINYFRAHQDPSTSKTDGAPPRVLPPPQAASGVLTADLVVGTEPPVQVDVPVGAAPRLDIPRSVCSESCGPGFRKAAQKGQPSCCFDCIPCSEGEISNRTDSSNCFLCSFETWPNENKTRCIPKAVEFLSYLDPLGLILTTAALFFSFTTLSILCIFYRNKETAIVKANNRNLTYLLLASLSLSFLCSLLFVGEPQSTICIFRQGAFGVIFVLSVSSVLAKTIMVVLAFSATKPGSNMRKWLGPGVPALTVSICTLLQLLICMSWILTCPPFPERNIKIKTGIIVFQCNECSDTLLWCMLGYMAFLACVSFMVAFMARKLPDSFNEAKWITFSMLIFLSVWISFVPAYLSTTGKYMVTVEIFGITSSSAGVLGCIFLPKSYIILFRPDLNTRGHLLGKGSNQKSEM